MIGRLIPGRLLALWGVLAVATLVGGALGLERSGLPAEGAGAAVLTLAFVKVRLVGLHFMELNRAPLVLRAVFESYVLLTYLAVTILYLAA